MPHVSLGTRNYSYKETYYTRDSWAFQDEIKESDTKFFDIMEQLEQHKREINRAVDEMIIKSMYGGSYTNYNEPEPPKRKSEYDDGNVLDGSYEEVIDQTLTLPAPK